MENKECKVVDRLDYEILATFAEKEANKPMFSITRKELGFEDVPQPTMWKHLKKLTNYNYIAFGGKVGRNNMYYLTEEGKNIIS